MGSHKSFHRHIPFFNDLGYSCVTFNLYDVSREEEGSPTRFLDFFSFLSRNLKHQITDVLDSVPGPKIVFSFSGPSLPAMVAVGRRDDVVKYVCDGGPFTDIWQCTYRMSQMMTGTSLLPVKFLWTTIGVIRWGPKAVERLHDTLKKWPKTLPILSIRGMKDPVVYPKNIENIFKEHLHLDLTVLELPEGAHLDGMKNFAEIYKTALRAFLS